MEVFSRTVKTRGYFSKFKRLKTRDPLSPIPFLLMMEVFTRMLRQMEGAGIIRGFKVHGVGGDRMFTIFFLFSFSFFFPEETSLITLQKGGTFLFHKMKKNDRGEKIMMKCLKVTSYDRTNILEELAAETN